MAGFTSSQRTVQLELTGRSVSLTQNEADALWRVVGPGHLLAEEYRSFALQAANAKLSQVWPQYRAFLTATDGWRLISIPVEGPSPRTERVYSASALWEFVCRDSGEASVKATRMPSSNFPVWNALVPKEEEINMVLRVGPRGADYFLTCEPERGANRAYDTIIFYPEVGERVWEQGGSHRVYEVVPDLEIIQGDELCRFCTKFTSDLSHIWPEGYTLHGKDPLSPFLAKPLAGQRENAAQALVLTMPINPPHPTRGEEIELI